MAVALGDSDIFSAHGLWQWDWGSQMAIGETGAERGLRPPVQAVLLLGLVVAGASLFNGAKWALLDGAADISPTMLYISRFFGVATYPVVAVLYRDHLPRMGCLLGTAASLVGFYVVSLALIPALSDARLAEILSYVSGIGYGVSTELLVLVLLHVFSSCNFRRGIVLIALTQALSNVVVLALAQLIGPAFYAARMGCVTIGFAMTAIAVLMLLKTSAGLDAPLETPSDENGVGHLAGIHPASNIFPAVRTDWLLFLSMYCIFQSLFGAVAQVSDETGGSFGLYDLYTGTILVVLDALIVLSVWLWGRRLSCAVALSVVAVMYAASFVVYHYAWQMGNPLPGALVRAGYDCSCIFSWIFLVRKAREDRERTYFYFAILGTMGNVQFGRLFGSFAMGTGIVRGDIIMSLSQASLFIVCLACVAAFLFVCARVSGSSSGHVAKGFVSLADAGGDVAKSPMETYGIDSLERRCEAFSERLSLTPREKEVLAEALRGHSRAGIAGKLGLSPETVKHYLGRIYQKAGVRSKEGLISLVDVEPTEGHVGV